MNELCGVNSSVLSMLIFLWAAFSVVTVGGRYTLELLRGRGAPYGRGAGEREREQMQ